MLTLPYPSHDYAELTGCLLRRDRRGRHLPHSRGGLRRARADGAGKDSVGTERPHCGGPLRSHACVSSHCLRHGKTWLNIRLPFCEAAVNSSSSWTFQEVQLRIRLPCLLGTRLPFLRCRFQDKPFSCAFISHVCEATPNNYRFLCTGRSVWLKAPGRSSWPTRPLGWMPAAMRALSLSSLVRRTKLGNLALR